MLPKIPLGLDKRRILAPVKERNLKERLPEVSNVPGSAYKVAYFAGCMATYIYPEVGESLVRVLNKNGVAVVFPKLQYCCGMPAHAAGEKYIARQIALENIKVLSELKVDAFVVSCGSCGVSLKENYPLLFNDNERVLQKAKEISSKLVDISQLIIRLNYKKHFFKPLDIKVTYHDPCHLAYGLGIAEEPREILKNIPALELREVEKGYCCGSGGAFSFKHYEVSAGITRRCIESISQTDAKLIATGCLACRMQLEEAIFQRGLPIDVMHTVQLLDNAYQSENNIVD